MDAVITALAFVAVLIVLLGIAGLVKPFWFMKKRRHGALIAIGAFVLFSVLNSIPLQRPDRIPEAEWAERVRVCRAAAQMRECPADDAMVAEARLEAAAAQRKAAEEEEVRMAEEAAKKAERLSESREREVAAAGNTVIGAAEKLEDPTQQALWIARTERAVKQQMRDPGSVRFRNSRFHIFRDQTPMVCGEVNARNGFGGATGYQRFIASGETFGPVLEEMMTPTEFAKSWNQICT